MAKINRIPSASEYGAYYFKYIQLVKGTDIISILEESKSTFIDFLNIIPADKWDYSYGWDKWTIKQIILHLIDTERIFAYRALCIARKDKTAFPGFEQDDYVDSSKATDRSAISLIEEYLAVRTATIQLFKNLPSEGFNEIGTASDNPLSPLAAAYIIAGHQQHHWNLFLEKYLNVL